MAERLEANARYLVAVDEWVLGDDDLTVVVGQTVRWRVRERDVEDEAWIVAGLGVDQLGEGEQIIFVLHAEDPAPPVEVAGRVTSIWAIPVGIKSDGRALSEARQVAKAGLDPEVDHFVFHVEGVAALHH